MERKVTSYDDFRREGFGGGFGTARVVDECVAVGELLEDLRWLKGRFVIRELGPVWKRSAEITHLEVHVPGLSTGNGPLPFDYEYRNSGDAALTSSFNLVFDRLDIFVGVEVCGGLT